MVTVIVFAVPVASVGREIAHHYLLGAGLFVDMSFGAYLMNLAPLKNIEVT